MEFYNSENTRNEQHIAPLATCHVSQKAVSCTGSQNREAADQLCEHLFEDGMTNGGDGSGYVSGPPLRIEPVMQCRPHKHVERANVDMDQVKMEKDVCFCGPFLENAQVAIFENKTAEKNQVESHGSMESCKSGNVLTKRKCSLEQQLILGSKRIKKQADDLKQSIRVKVGDVECLVRCQYVSNCDFLEHYHLFETEITKVDRKRVLAGLFIEMRETKTNFGLLTFRGVKPNVDTYNKLLDGYCKDLKMNEAFNMYNGLRAKAEPEKAAYDVAVMG
ncbi:hypothetical protein L1987_03214 [Smallanthus sonchifolius]|uniref:Uncharacterized protein n=1 Tax=Smallanthus sonchifolius TaxID=185202 RepID=A0ACB9KA85_9ASTR|nr:hypothetical protein L1987_03214 [Smallanthus sonchifolius]